MGVPGVDGVVGTAEEEVGIGDGDGAGDAPRRLAFPVFPGLAVEIGQRIDALRRTNIDVGALDDRLGVEGAGDVGLPVQPSLRRGRADGDIAAVAQVAPDYRPGAGALVNGDLGVDVAGEDDGVGREGVVDPHYEEDEEDDDAGGNDAAH